MGEVAAVSRWSAAQLAPRRRFEAWCEVVSATHLPFAIEPARGAGEDALGGAEMAWQALSATNLIACLCGPCHGQRAERELSRQGETFYGVLYIHRGQELVRQAGREAHLRAGHFLLWDSTRPLEFRVPGRLAKLTLLIPQRELEAHLPDAAELVATPIDGRSGPGALFATHLRALSRSAAAVPASGHAAVQRATLELLATALAPYRRSGAAPHRLTTLARVQDHILTRLQDPALTPEAVAAAFGISLRHLHRLFSAGELTLERWIRHQRLLRCREELETRPEAAISQVAFRWGFNDAAHFSRAFRALFGESPRDCRKRVRRSPGEA